MPQAVGCAEALANMHMKFHDLLSYDTVWILFIVHVLISTSLIFIEKDGLAHRSGMSCFFCKLSSRVDKKLEGQHTTYAVETTV
jgi:hypothetical protein